MEDEKKLEIQETNVVEISAPESIILEEGKPTCHLCGEPAFHICRNSLCLKYHCTNHTSNVDLDKCSSCSEPITITVTKVSKTETDYDEIKDEILTETHVAKSIHFDGSHWLSNSLIINKLPDDLLRQHIQYSKAMVHQLETELLYRKITKTKAHLSAHPFSGRLDKRGALKSTETTTTKKTRTKRSAASTEDKVMAALSSNGMDVQKLLALLQKKVAGK